MNYSPKSLERLAKNITEKITDELDRVGIFHRTFYRCKDSASINSKLESKNYDGIRTFLRDIVGMRSNLYFTDDIDIIYPYFKSVFDFVEETRDQNIETEFKPTRLNIIFRITKDYRKEFREIVANTKIDDVFEYQIRTVLSEGWHEVDHDMRYKCKSDWNDNQDLGRMLNGVLAALEASDWTIIQIFEKLAYRHYRNNMFESMLRLKFRIRLIPSQLDSNLKMVIDNDNELRRSFYKISRHEFLSKFLTSNVIIPINITNLTYLLNHMFIQNENISTLMPGELRSEIYRMDRGM